jgi:hypothetical protein
MSRRRHARASSRRVAGDASLAACHPAVLLSICISRAISTGRSARLFARLGRTLAESGAGLSDMVTMTVFLTDSRYDPRFLELRREIFGDDFPASALITVVGLARPELLVEVQGVAVIP